MRAETNSTVSAGSMPLRQAQPASRVEAVVPPDVLGEAEEGSGLGIEHPRAVEAARGFPEQGAGAFQRQESVHVFDEGVGRHDDGGRFIVPFFLHALEFHGKGVFRVDAGGTDTARTLPDMRNGEGPASGPRCRRSSRTCPIASGSRSSATPTGGSCFRTTKRIRVLRG